MDKTTERGMPPAKVARMVLEAIVWQRDDVVIAGFVPRVAIWGKFLWPSLYRYFMQQRAVAASNPATTP